MDFDIEKLKCIFTYFEEYIYERICLVLNDSPTDPDYSAVAVTSLIKSYIQIKTEMGEKLPFSNVEEYFLHKGFSKEEYDFFEKSRKSESVYYRGVQY